MNVTEMDIEDKWLEMYESSVNFRFWFSSSSQAFVIYCCRASLGIILQGSKA